MVTNNPGSGEAIETVSASSFTGWKTDVGYITIATPTNVARSRSGSAVNWDVTVDPNDTTVWLTIMTNATLWKDTGNPAIIDNGVAVVTGLAAPAVVEPSTWTMMLLGFGGVGAAAFGRRRKTNISIA